MTEGLVFDIKEFALNDGPGIRTTVFMKGCHLRCWWCHNPEGISFYPQYNVSTGKIVGTVYDASSLASKLLQFKDLYLISHGGVTFSGGEPLSQGDFVYDVASILKESAIHLNLDTSGFCSCTEFVKVINIFNLVFFDLKIIDQKKHKLLCGVDNSIILKNLRILSESCIPYHIRIPLIPGITDSEKNLFDIYECITKLPRLPLEIDLLSYNILAGGKYQSYNMKYPLTDLSTSLNDKNISNFISLFSAVNVKLY